MLDGLTDFVTDTFVLKCLQTMTGVKIFVASTPQFANTQADLLRKISQAYADYVSKNPFQEAEMPIKSQPFDQAICGLFV